MPVLYSKPRKQLLQNRSERQKPSSGGDTGKRKTQRKT